jgi:ketosteroid isomerase-like protein
MKDFYTQTEDILLSMDGTIVKGQDDVDEYLKTFMQSVKQMSEVKMHGTHIALLSRKAASVTYEFSWSAITQDDETTNMKGTATYAMEKAADRWRVVHLVGFHTPADDESKGSAELTEK